MAEVKWIKIVTDIFDDEKILLIESLPEADSVIVIWFKLLCMAGKQNNDGVFMLNNKIPYTDEMLATIFRRPVNTVRLALETFRAYGMIEIIDNVITIPKWSKHQTLDAYDKKKERDKLYQQERRERQKLLISGKSSDNRLTVAFSSSDVAISEEDIERDKEIEIDKDKDKDKDKEKDNYNKNINKEKNKEGAKTSRFRPPSLEEVEDYCRERGNSVDAETFVDFYASKNWMVGKNKMSDWKAAVRTWEKRETERAVERYKNKNNAHEAVMDWLAWSEANEGSGCFDWVGGEEEE